MATLAQAGKCGSSNCFDGVYAVKGDTIYINEVKPLNVDGSIKLSSDNSAGTLGTQMSDKWIYGAVNRLKSGTLEQQQTAAIIEKAIADNKLVRVVTGADSSSLTIVKLQ